MVQLYKHDVGLWPCTCLGQSAQWPKVVVVSNAQAHYKSIRKVSQVRYGIVEFNVPLDMLYVNSWMILQVRCPNQQYHSTEGQWLVNCIKGQSHQAQVTKR